MRLVLWFSLGAPLLRSGLPGSFWRRLLLRAFGAVVGPGVVLKPHIVVKFPWRLVIGSHSWIGEYAWLDNLAWIRIGANVCISQGAYLCTGNHDYRDPAFSYRLGEITVQSQAWICAMSRIAPGVTVAEGAVLGIGAVATCSLLPFTLYSGNPAVPTGSRLAKTGITEPP